MCGSSGLVTVSPVIKAGEDVPSEEAKRQVVHEYELFKCLKHPNLLQVVNARFDRKNPSIEYSGALGQPLDDYVASSYPEGIPPFAAWCLALQMTAGTECLHAHGIVHGDLNPTTVTVNSDGLVKLVGYGHAFRVGTKDDAELRQKPTDPRYCAPEWERDGPKPSFQSDQHAIGMLVLHLCTKTDPTYPWPGCPSDVVVQNNLRHAGEEGWPYCYATKPEGLDDAAWEVAGPLVSLDPDDRPTTKALMETLHDVLICQLGQCARSKDIPAELWTKPVDNLEILKIHNGASIAEFKGTQMDIDTTWALALAIIKSRYLLSLKLVENNLDPRCVSLLIKAIGLSSSLRNVTIQKNVLGDNGAIEISHILRGNRVLECLCLSSTSIQDTGGQALADALCSEHNKWLLKLCLHGNNIGDARAKSLASVAKRARVEGRELEINVSSKKCRNHSK